MGPLRWSLVVILGVMVASFAPGHVEALTKIVGECEVVARDTDGSLGCQFTCAPGTTILVQGNAFRETSADLRFEVSASCGSQIVVSCIGLTDCEARGTNLDATGTAGLCQVRFLEGTGYVRGFCSSTITVDPSF